MPRAERVLLLATSLLMSPVALSAQRTVTTPADAGREAGPVHRFFLGHGYRDAWVVPITAPVLRLDTFAGGLTAFREGGNHSRTLRFRAANGKVYHFRSIPKFMPRNLPDDLQNTPAAWVINDQTSSMHPTGPLVVAGLQAAAGILQSVPHVVVLPDDPRLGEFRETFAGMLGTIEERPQDYDDNEAINFAGADKVQDSEKLLENLELSSEYYLEPRAYLRARLMDILVGDTDRGADQWEFARFDRADRKVYLAVPKDRDYSFFHGDGVLPRLAASVYGKLNVFGPEFGGLKQYVFMTREFDRTHLSELGWQDWEREVRHLQSVLTDRVIDAAVARMPEPQHRITGPKLAAALKSRRDKLPELAREYFAMISEEAVVFGTDDDEIAQIDRHADGSVTVRLYREAEGRVAAGTNATDGQAARTRIFERRFLPHETSEIRVHMERGDDYVVVRGGGNTTIDVRVTGGEGDDVLIDSTRVTRSHTYTTFYDAHGNNTFVTGPHTRVSRKPFVTRQPPEPEEEEDDEPRPPRVAQQERRGRFQDLLNEGEGFFAAKLSAHFVRDWGESSGIGPAWDIREGTGVVLGARYSHTDYGFRRDPYETRYTVTGLVSPTTGRLGAQLYWDRHPENSPWSYSVLARASQFEANRFFGWGNDSEFDDVALTLVRRDELQLYPSLNYRVGRHGSVSVGPVFKHNYPHLEDFSPAANEQPFGVQGSLSQLGIHAEALINTADGSSLPRSGFTIRAGASSYPGMLNIPRPFHEVHGMAATYIELGSPVLALRAGGKHIWGDTFPLHEAAFVGGRETLRGFRWNRFAGDASIFGGAELRVPITRLVLLTRGDFGVLALGDAGRVFYRGDSGGGWHAGWGGGVWFETLDQLITLTYARGDDEGRFYFKLGAPF